MRHAWRALGLVVLGALLVVVGCSGSGETARNQGGIVRGQVNLGGAAPSSLNLVVDGQPVEVEIGADGVFAVPGLPPGEHVVDVVSDDGMSGGRATVVVDPDGTVVIEDPIDLEGAGRIAGKVVKQTEAGEEPLAGVEVVARGDLVWIMTDEGRTLAPDGSTDAEPLIYPPPDDAVLETYTAFTGEDGQYAMDGVKPGGYLVVVAVPGLTAGQAWVYVEADQEATADFVLQAAIEPGVGTIQGTVTGEQETGDPVPLEGAVVSVTYPGGGGGFEPVPGSSNGLETAQAEEPGVGVVLPPDIYWGEFRSLTDQLGHYSLNVPSGYATVSAWADNFSWEGSDVTIQPQETVTKDFLLLRWDDVIPLPEPGPEPEPGAGGEPGQEPPVPPDSR